MSVMSHGRMNIAAFISVLNIIYIENLIFLNYPTICKQAFDFNLKVQP